MSEVTPSTYPRIVFSALGPSLSEQCERHGLVASGKPLDTLDRIADALTIAHIHGVLTDSEVTRARARLFKQAKFTVKGIA
jgi:hypothetical protein